MKGKLFKILSYILVALVASALTLLAVLVFARNGYSKLEQLEDLILERFIGEVDRTAMEDAAARAMVDSLGDRWSYYLSAEEFKDYQEQMANAYVGIGVTIQPREDGTGLQVVQVTAGASAEQAGILAGDIIIRVDGTSVADLDTSEVRNLIRGEAGSTVKVTVLRNGEEKEFTVVRKEIQTPVATHTMLENNIGLVTIVNFDSRCADETIAAIESLLEQGAQRLIFDVRYNPGGYKKELVKVLDYLCPEGLLFRSEYYNGKIEDDMSDESCLNVPMAVLVNGSSYSAAEFFAAALRDYDKAVIIGEQTCGKGYFQSTFQLQDGSAVGLSIGKYYTPGGVSLADVGITPDLQIDVDDETAAKIYSGTLDPMEDPQILAAIDALK